MIFSKYQLKFLSINTKLYLCKSFTIYIFMKPNVSLIISTYNWPEALNLCLQSVLHQSVLPNEIIIADDGSKEETRELINSFKKICKIPLIHVWHEDKGFRKTMIMNEAFTKVSYPYIVQIDGDIILHKDFIKDHIRFAQSKSFVSGSRVIIDEKLTKKLIQKKQWKFSIFTNGLHNRLNGIRIPFLSKFQEHYRQNDIIYVRGCNMAFWKEDLLKVNGYNEEITGWGREDNELAARLINTGISKRIIKFSAICFHLYHNQCSRDFVVRNDIILNKTLSEKRIRCKQGIDSHRK